jgi:protocatechuate 3,4-dioxygenase beta subunit
LVDALDRNTFPVMRSLLLFALTLSLLGCRAQQEPEGQHSDKEVGGPCEGCEALFEFGERELSDRDTLPAFIGSEEKLILTGTVYEEDGRTPASGIIVYAYHTDNTGVYPKQGNETGWGKRHGILRGWARTGKDGRYTFHTTKPAAYQDGGEPAHIHITVKEPGLTAYYIDDVLFENDTLLTEAVRARQPERGASGIVSLRDEAGVLIAERDIVLGRNIPGYR